MLAQNGLKKLDAKLQGQVVATVAKAQLLDETTETDSDDETKERKGPYVTLMLKVG